MTSLGDDREAIRTPTVARAELDVSLLKELAEQLRVDAIRASAAAGARWPASALSAAELMAVLIARHLRVDLEAPADPGRDHLIVSKGHAAPLLYAALRAIGGIDEAELLTYRRLGSRLQRNPLPGVPLVEVATGSLGMGLAVGAGMALAMQRLEPRSSRVWVICGDGEVAEGSVWEAVEAAGAERLDALTAIIDINRLAQTSPTRHVWDLAALRRRFEAFDWRVLEIEGHDISAIDTAYRTASETRFRPTAVLARTIKGRLVHRVPASPAPSVSPLAEVDKVIPGLGGVRSIRVTPPSPVRARSRDRRSTARRGQDPPRWAVGDRVSTRDAIGEALIALGTRRPDLVVLDADVGDSTRLGRFRDLDPRRFFQPFVAEQLMVGAAMGLGIRGWTALAGSFAAFMLRAADIVRLASIGGTPLRIVGSHPGVSVGVDGPIHMGLEDIAFFRVLHDSTVVQPSDATQAALLLEAVLDRPGVSYLRLMRAETLVRTPADADIHIGGSRELLSSVEDRITIVASGATVEEAAEAARRLGEDGIPVRLIDAYSVKPLDVDSVARGVVATGGRLLVVEDHRPEGGLGSAVAEALGERGVPHRLAHLAVRGMPGFADPAEQRHLAGIDADAIHEAATALVSTTLPLLPQTEMGASDAGAAEAGTTPRERSTKVRIDTPLQRPRSAGGSSP